MPLRRTAWRVNHGAAQRELVAEAMRGVLKALLAAAPELRGHLPRGWRRLCQVDRNGNPLPLSAT